MSEEENDTQWELAAWEMLAEAKEQLKAERALADRLAGVLQPLLIATWREKQPSKAELAFTAWKEARSDH